MILSNVEIHKAIDERRLVISPEPLPRLPGGINESPYQTSAVDLRLGNEISYFKEGLPFDINLRQGPFARLFGPNSVTQIITDEQRPFLGCLSKPGRESMRFVCCFDAAVLLGRKSRLTKLRPFGKRVLSIAFWRMTHAGHID